MGILVIALSINPRPLSALELKLSGLIMESRVDTAGDNQNAHVIISNYIAINIKSLKLRDKSRVTRVCRYQTISAHLLDIAHSFFL